MYVRPFLFSAQHHLPIVITAPVDSKDFKAVNVKHTDDVAG